MTGFQKVIHYLTLAFAIFLIVSIVGGILSAVGLLAGFTRSADLLETPKQYPVSGTIRELELEIGAAALTVETADRFGVESDLPDLRVEVKNGCLQIVQKDQLIHTNKVGHVTVYLPEDILLDEVDFTTGAGDVRIEALSTRELDMELGAGRLEIGSLQVTGEGKLTGGTGEVSILDGELHDMKISMGVGRLDLTARLTGSCKIDCGVGAVELTLLGSMADYRIEAEKGLGRVTVNGDSVSDRETFGSGSDRVKINGGVGDIAVKCP